MTGRFRGYAEWRARSPARLSCLIDPEARLSLLPAVPQVGETVDGVHNLADHEASPHAVVAIPPGRWCRCLISVRRHGGCLAFARHASVRMRQDIGGMSASLTTTPHWITMQAVMAGAFMIVDSFGHYLAQTVHDHGPPPGRYEYAVALCRSMHKHTQRATPAIQHA